MLLWVSYLLPGIAATLGAWSFAQKRGWSRVARACGVAVAFGLLCAPAIVASRHGIRVTRAVSILIADPTNSWGYALIVLGVLITFVGYMLLSITYTFVMSRAKLRWSNPSPSVSSSPSRD